MKDNFEYRLLKTREIIKRRRKDTNPGDVGDEVVLFAELNELGNDGWDIIPMNNDFIAKRRI